MVQNIQLFDALKRLFNGLAGRLNYNTLPQSIFLFSFIGMRCIHQPIVIDRKTAAAN
jgi:hypothetical protein